MHICYQRNAVSDSIGTSKQTVSSSVSPMRQNPILAWFLIHDQQPLRCSWVCNAGHRRRQGYYERTHCWDWRLGCANLSQWRTWKASLTDLSNLSISRPFTATSSSAAVRRELCIFCDASTKAFAAVAYLKDTGAAGNNNVGFVMGKVKLALWPEHTIPRLDLDLSLKL